jgi:hypothetical protein
LIVTVAGALVSTPPLAVPLLSRSVNVSAAVPTNPPGVKVMLVPDSDALPSPALETTRAGSVGCQPWLACSLGGPKVAPAARSPVAGPAPSVTS